MTNWKEQIKAQQERRRRDVQSMGAGSENDFEMLACMAVHGGYITESRAREILACTITEFREAYQHWAKDLGPARV